MQVNKEVNKKLIKLVLDAVKPHHGMKVLDLFCGLGNFTLPLAKEGAEVLGIDIVSSMIKDAQKNAELNDLHNAKFAVADLEDEFEKQLETFDLLIVVSGEKLTDSEMSILLDACLVHRVPTALFLSDDTPSLGAVREMAAQEFYVGIPKNGQSFLIKDMATSEINRYRFNGEGQVEITKATEKEFVQECPDIHF